MEVRNQTQMAGSEIGIMSGRELFGVGVQKNQILQQPPPNMRLAYSPDGTAVYKQVASGDGPTAPVVQHSLNSNAGEQVKRKRGRPRKYGPDGTMALALTPVSLAVPQSGGSASVGASASASGGEGRASAGFPTETEPSLQKKARGRPPGSGKKHQMAALGIGFTPHVIMVKAGEDVSSKIMSFSQHGPRAVCILSANGAISNVTLRQAATSGGTVTYEFHEFLFTWLKTSHYSGTI